MLPFCFSRAVFLDPAAVFDDFFLWLADVDIVVLLLVLVLLSTWLILLFGGDLNNVIIRFIVALLGKASR